MVVFFSHCRGTFSRSAPTVAERAFLVATTSFAAEIARARTRFSLRRACAESGSKRRASHRSLFNTVVAIAQSTSQFHRYRQDFDLAAPRVSGDTSMANFVQVGRDFGVRSACFPPLQRSSRHDLVVDTGVCQISRI